LNLPPERIVVKRGDAVMLGCTAFDETGAGADLSLVTVKSQVWPEKDGQPMVAEMVVEWVDRPNGAFELWAPGDGLATDWPTGNLRIDIQYSQPQPGARVLRRSTETFYIYIERDVTQ
jgi:hypothetical protein